MTRLSFLKSRTTNHELPLPFDFSSLPGILLDPSILGRHWCASARSKKNCPVDQAISLGMVPPGCRISKWCLHRNCATRRLSAESGVNLWFLYDNRISMCTTNASRAKGQLSSELNSKRAVVFRLRGMPPGDSKFGVSYNARIEKIESCLPEPESQESVRKFSRRDELP